MALECVKVYYMVPNKVKNLLGTSKTSPRFKGLIRQPRIYFFISLLSGEL